MKPIRPLKAGDHVRVPWGLEADRDAVVVEIWGPADAPTQIRVELVGSAEDDEAATLLLNPKIIVPA